MHGLLCSRKIPYRNIARRSPLLFSIFLYQTSCTPVQSIQKKINETTYHKMHLDCPKSEACPTLPCISLVELKVIPQSPASGIESPRAWVTGRRNRQCARSSLSSDFDDVCHCEGKCAERGTDVDVRADTGRCCGIRTVRDKDLRTQLKRTCGKLWGRPGRRPRTFEGDSQGPCMSSVQLLSARRCTFEHCTSCCPSRHATMVALTKKKPPNAAYHSTKRSFEGRCQRRKRDVLSSPQFGSG